MAEKKFRGVPEGYSTASDNALAAGDKAAAIRLLNSASAVSLGHKRSARYEAAAEELAQEAKIPCTSELARDKDRELYYPNYS